MHFLAFTISLHAFGLLLYLTSLKHNAAGIGFHKEEVRTLLNDSLDSLRVIGRTSLMSQKARRCLLRFLSVFDSMSTYARNFTCSPSAVLQWSLRLIAYFASFR